MWNKLISAISGTSNEAQNGEQGPKGENPFSEPIVELYVVHGCESQQLLTNASIQFDAKSITFKGEAPDNQETDTYEFQYGAITRFRQHQSDMFQWMVGPQSKSSDDAPEEYGLLFIKEELANQFHQVMMAYLFENAEHVLSIDTGFKYYCRISRKWINALEDSKEDSVYRAEVIRLPGTMESFLVLQDCKKEEGDKLKLPLCYIAISHDEYIFALPDIKMIQWWGLCGYENKDKRLYAIDLSKAKEENMKKFYDTFDTALKMALYKSERIEDTDKNQDDYAMDIDENDKHYYEFDAEIVTTDEEDEGTAVIQKDPSDQMLQTDPKRLVNRNLITGSSRGYVFRCGGTGANLTSDMQVFSYDNVGKHDVVASVDGSKFNYKGDQLIPSASLLHDHESKFVLLDSKHPTSAYMMDIEKETIVQKWDTEGMKMSKLIPNTSDAALTGDPTFLSINPQNVFRFDTRINGAAARKETLSYASKVDFTCGVTTSNGELLLGSQGGDLRLYDGKPGQDKDKLKRAKTHIPGIGDPIIYVDVISDGSWILGTCTKYLVLYPVKLSSSGKTGFVTALGASKPSPIVLRLKLEDISRYNLQSFEFKKAEFDADEKNIITATNNLVIMWDFTKVKKGEVNSYKISKIADYIKDAKCIKTGKGETVVVATPCNITTKGVKMQ